MEAEQLPPDPVVNASLLDLDSWKGDLQRLHGTIDQVVQSFIASQTRQLDAVAAELASQKERIVVKERCFSELSNSIAGFVEEEAKRLEVWGLPLDDATADALHEAYDAELPGPPVLHRINRLWRKATRAFDAMKEAKEREAAKALEDQRVQFESHLADAEKQCSTLRQECENQVAYLQDSLGSLKQAGQHKDCQAQSMTEELEKLKLEMCATKRELAEKGELIEKMNVAKNRSEYEWGAERDSLARENGQAKERVTDLERTVADGRQRESELMHKCADQGQKLEQMKRTMDDQERELTQKIDRVQHYVKERQTGALHAEQKQKDAERMADRWQSEVRRLQAERDRLAALVLDLETHQTGQATSMKGLQQQHQDEVAALKETLRKNSEEMRNTNLELLQKRDDEYQTKVNLERQREKDRSIALLKKKEQEVQIKDQQLKAARQRIQELETSSSAPTNTGSPCSDSPRSRGSSASRRLSTADAGLPRLPLSAR